MANKFVTVNLNVITRYMLMQ